MTTSREEQELTLIRQDTSTEEGTQVLLSTDGGLGVDQHGCGSKNYSEEVNMTERFPQPSVCFVRSQHDRDTDGSVRLTHTALR